MKLFVPFRRATLLIPTGAAQDRERKHLFIVVTNPTQVSDLDGKRLLLVGVFSVNPDLPHDPACELNVGDHSFIRHKSYVHFERARIEPVQGILHGVKEGLLVPKDVLVEAVFSRVCKGLTASTFTPPKILSFYEAAEKLRNEAG